MGAADTTTKLMQLSQPKFVCTVNENSVSTWYINTSFDDSRTNQNIKTLMVKI